MQKNCGTFIDARGEGSPLYPLCNRPLRSLAPPLLIIKCQPKLTLITLLKGDKPISLIDIERRYEVEFPSWNKRFQCFPEGPIFYDKLFKKEPSTRAINIEKKFMELKEKISDISFIPFDTEIDDDETVITKTIEEIIQSLQLLITDLKLTNNSRVKNGVPKVLRGKIIGVIFIGFVTINLECIFSVRCISRFRFFLSTS